MSPVFTVRALDVRPPSLSSAGHDPTDFLHLRADAEPSAAASASSGGASGTVIGLAVLLVLVTLGASAAAWYIIRQRKQLLSMGTIRVLYNVDNLAQDSEANKAGILPEEKTAKLDVSTGTEEKMFTIDLSDNAKPRAIPIPPVSSEPSHTLPSAMLRRKHSRNVARQRLRIIIPSGVAIPDVELVTTATVNTATPNTGRSSAVSTVRGGSISRRNTARTPSRTPRSALSSAMSAMSSAAVAIVHRRETVEPVYQSNGWAPATIVYLPKNPRDMNQQAAHSPTVARKVTRKSTRRVPPTAGSIAPGVGQADEKAILVA